MYRMWPHLASQPGMHVSVSALACCALEKSSAAMSAGGGGAGGSGTLETLMDAVPFGERPKVTAATATSQLKL